MERNKISLIFIRFVSSFLMLPTRLLRLGRHFGRILKMPFLAFVIETAILILEITGIGEFYETINHIFKPNVRLLTDYEITEARLAFGDNIDYKRVLIDEKALLGCKKGNFAYASFYMINYWGKMSDSHLVHELAHVWQYERIGARYMPRAIQAQQSREGYNYGGVTALQELENQNLTNFHSLNMEQQAEVFTDFYLIQKNKRPQYGNATSEHLPIYKKYCELASI